jgi:hypothetical protein
MKGSPGGKKYAGVGPVLETPGARGKLFPDRGWQNYFGGWLLFVRIILGTV